jgi:hypothetical protein
VFFLKNKGILKLMVSDHRETWYKNIRYPCESHEGIWESGVTVPFILNLDNPRMQVINLTFQPLYPCKQSPQYLPNRRLSGH